MSRPIYVRVLTGSGWTLVPHTPEEYARLWQGTDPEVVEAMARPDVEEAEDAAA